MTPQPVPDCPCHGEPMLFEPDKRYVRGGFWRCKTKHRERKRKWFANMTGLQYNHRLLKQRRTQALARRRIRRQRTEGLDG